jgi:diguanylate cyclase (GGDEF)-like protein
MFDIDKFKNINETYGHDVGDIAIKEVAKILHTSLRKSDLIARIGGEEFCVLLQNTNLQNAKSIFEKIRSMFENNIIYIDNIQLSYTVSIGVRYGLDETLEDMIKKADEQLYYCKEHGRNQVSISDI